MSPSVRRCGRLSTCPGPRNSPPRSAGCSTWSAPRAGSDRANSKLSPTSGLSVRPRSNSSARTRTAPRSPRTTMWSVARRCARPAVSSRRSSTTRGHRTSASMRSSGGRLARRSWSLCMESSCIWSRDEVGEVAEAFTAVLRSAVRLATEQALMRHNVDAIFVNLARRSQTLVERQLQLLDELESSEEDPDQLTNLFRLDHLATRMRRNDNNLLVLAGGEPSRRWTEPVPLAAVILAAAAEIEYYTRVRHDITDNIHLVGHAVADVVHLVAELLENATIFSPPDTGVTVMGWAAEDGEAALVIQDEGIGMSPEGLARAGQLVAAPVCIAVAAAEA